MVDSDFGMVIEGGVPVYHPSYEEFKDFRAFVERIEPTGMQTGIVKIVPPKEWLDSLPEFTPEMLASIKIKHPIVQNVTGSHGVYRFQNVEKARTYSIDGWKKVCQDRANQPPPKRGATQSSNEGFTSDSLTDYDDSEFTAERCEELERNFWRSIGFSMPMYGADMPGSLFTEKVKDWNVANLDSVLSNLDVKIPGVNTAYLYCGMWKACFPWHLEDMDLHSINYIHFGAPKQWYSISQADRPRFFKIMKAIFPREFRGCPEFLRHKTFLVSPAILEEHGVKVNKVVHRQREFVITWAYGYHAGYNYGYNVAESVNFATPNWLDIGVKSNKCQCITDSVGIDVRRMIRQINGEPLSPPSSPEAIEEDTEELAKPEKKKSKRRPSAEPKQAQAKKPKTHRKGDCALCPHRWDNIYIENAAKTAAVHVICGKLLPETSIASDVVSGLEDIPPERFKLKCIECKTSFGACLQCAFGKCTRSYHATCALSAGMTVEKGQLFCRFHQNSVDHSDAAASRAYASGLLVGDIVQCTTPRRVPFAGVVEENILAEGILVIQALPDRDQRLEVQYEQVIAREFDLESVGRRDEEPEIEPAQISAPVSAPEPVPNRPELFATTAQSGEVVSPFIFMGIPVPDCLKRSHSL